MSSAPDAGHPAGEATAGAPPATRGAAPATGAAPRAPFAPFLLAWIPYAVLVKAFWFVTDDAFISFRYAKNWADGMGLRYNPGEAVPVEGYSNFLWVAWCALVERLHGDVAFWAPLASFVAGSVLLWLVYRTLRAGMSVSGTVAVLATLALGTFAPFFIWSTSGLETMPFVLAVFVAFERLAVRRDDSGAAWIAGVAALAAALIRVEGMAWVVLVFLGAAATRRLEDRAVAGPLLRAGAIVLPGFVAFLLWRHAYHGDWVANTAAAKVGVSAAVIGRGLEYVATFVLTFLTPLLLVPASVVALRPERRALGLPLVGLTAASYGYAAAVGGDFMAMGRLLAPGWPFATLLFGGLLARLAERGPGRLAGTTALAAGAIVVALLPAVDVHLAPESVRRRFNVREYWGKYWSEIEYWNVMRLNGARWKRLGMALREYAPPGASVVAPGIGYIGYFSGLVIHDQAGLVDREVAHRPVGELTAPGHDKAVPPEFFLSREPDLMSPVLVREGPELERTRATLEAEADRLRTDFGADYEVVLYEPFGGHPPPREMPDAEGAVLANLLAPFRTLHGPDRPKELMLVLKRRSA